MEVNYLNDGEYKNGIWEQLMEITIDDVQLDLLINERMKGIMEMTKPTYLSFVCSQRLLQWKVKGKLLKKTFLPNPMLLLPVLLQPAEKPPIFMIAIK